MLSGRQSALQFIERDRQVAHGDKPRLTDLLSAQVQRR
jgi:hypothetical protein